MLVFPIAELPEMAKGKGVILQRYAGGIIADVKAFNLAEGLTYKFRGTDKQVESVEPWIGKRAQAGRLPPNGFPQSNKFE